MTEAFEVAVTTPEHAPANAPGPWSLVGQLRYEVVPMASLDTAIADLPPGASVTVTCSPSKGNAATQREVVRLTELGHTAVPHIAARQVEDRAQVGRLASWCRAHGIDEVFVVAGDAPQAAGPYEGAVPFISDLLDTESGITAIGVAGYPDGHPMIDTGILAAHLFAKRDLLASAGIRGWVTSQMCLDPDTTLSWLTTMRASGMDLPLHLGIPGIVERKRLLAMGTRLGVGASMRFLRKNRSMVRVAARRYDPIELVAAVSEHADVLDVEAVHAFTFNSVGDTRAWHEAITASLTPGCQPGVRLG